MDLVRLNIAEPTSVALRNCQWDESAFSVLNPEERLKHLMTEGVYALKPNYLLWFLLQVLAAVTISVVRPGILGWILLSPIRRLVADNKRSAAPYGIDTVLKGCKFPMLYLRSFASDYHQSSELPFVITSTSERRLVKALTRRLGCRMVAVARPHDELGDFGALRVWIDCDWQEKVMEFIRCAPVVVIRLDATPGVLWELEQAVRLAGPDRLVLEIPEWTQEVLDALNKALPAIHRHKGKPSSGRFVVFDADWSSTILGRYGQIASRFQKSRRYHLPPLPNSFDKVVGNTSSPALN